MTNLKRIYLLPEAEIADLYARPVFNQNEQQLYFELTQVELDTLGQFGTIKTKVHFILQLAYFKAKNQFFSFTFDDVRADVDYVLAKFFKKTDVVFQGNITRQRINQQKQIILNLFDYQAWSVEQAIQVEAHIGELLRYYPKVHDAFRQLLVYLDNQKIVLPTYRSLQDIFTQSFANERDRLDQLILLMPHGQQEQLSELIDREDGITKLNIIRADQKNFTYTAISAEVEKALGLEGLYKFAKDFLPTLLLSKNAIRYYADIAGQYAASRLRRLDKPQQWLHALCFIYHRYQQIMDNLITSFMYHTRAITVDAKAYAKKAAAEYHSGLVVDLPKLAKFLKWFPNRKTGLNHDELNQAAYKILPERQFPALAQFLQGSTFDTKAAIREFYLKSSRSSALYLRPILLAVPFVFYKEDSDIMELIDLMKVHYGSGKGPSTFKLPQDIEDTLSKTQLPYLKKDPDDAQVDPHLFEFFVYHKMYRRLDKGLLCCNESVSYCDIDHDLISAASWWRTVIGGTLGILRRDVDYLSNVQQTVIEILQPLLNACNTYDHSKLRSSEFLEPTDFTNNHRNSAISNQSWMCAEQLRAQLSGEVYLPQNQRIYSWMDAAIDNGDFNFLAGCFSLLARYPDSVAPELVDPLTNVIENLIEENSFDQTNQKLFLAQAELLGRLNSEQALNLRGRLIDKTIDALHNDPALWLFITNLILKLYSFDSPVQRIDMFIVAINRIADVLPIYTKEFSELCAFIRRIEAYMPAENWPTLWKVLEQDG